MQVPARGSLYLGQGSAWAQISAGSPNKSLPDGRDDASAVVPAEHSVVGCARRAAAVVSIVPGQGYDFAIPTKLFAAAACGTPVLFAGEGASVEVVREAAIGTAVDYDDRTGRPTRSSPRSRLQPTPADRTRISAGCGAHASIDATGDRAAEVVEGSAR